MKKVLLILALIIGVGAPCTFEAAAQYHQTQQAGKNVKAYYYGQGGVCEITIQIKNGKVIGYYNGYNWTSVDATIQRNNGGDSSTSSQEWYQFTARMSNKARLGQITVYFNA